MTAIAAAGIRDGLDSHGHHHSAADRRILGEGVFYGVPVVDRHTVDHNEEPKGLEQALRRKKKQCNK